MTDARGPRPREGSAVITSSRPREGTPRNTRSNFARPALAGSIRRSAGSATSGRYARFSPSAAGARPAPRCGSAASCAGRRGRAGPRRRCRTSPRRRRRRGGRPGGRRRGGGDRPRGVLPARRARGFLRAAAASTARARVVARDPADAAAAARARAAEPDVRQVGLDAPRPGVARRPRRTATAGRGGRCCRRAARARARARRACAPRCTGSPSGRAQQAVLDRLGEHRVRASASVPGRPRGPSRRRGRRRTAARACGSANSVSVWTPRSRRSGADDRRVGERVAVDLAAAGRPGSRPRRACACAAANWLARSLTWKVPANASCGGDVARRAARAGAPEPCSPSAARPPGRAARPGGRAGGRAPRAPRRRARGRRRRASRRRSARARVTPSVSSSTDLRRRCAGRRRRRAPPRRARR